VLEQKIFGINAPPTGKPCFHVVILQYDIVQHNEIHFDISIYIFRALYIATYCAQVSGRLVKIQGGGGGGGGREQRDYGHKINVSNTLPNIL